MKKVHDLVNELISKDVSNERMIEIRDELLKIVFSYNDSSVFDFLVSWNIAVKQRIINGNLEIPGNATDIVSIVSLIEKLSFQNKK